MAGQRHDQRRGFPGPCQPGELAADRLDLRRPVQAQHPAQRGRRAPGRALGPRLPQQRQEHQHDQHHLQPVKPVPHPAVGGPGALQQPGARQRGQRQQQPGQRIAGTGREHRGGALAQQPEPGQHPLAVPRHRVRQHRQRLLLPARGLLPGRSRISGRPSGSALSGTIAPGRAQHITDRRFRHPGRGGDAGLAQALPVQFPDPRHHGGVQPRGSPRALAVRDQARDPAGRQRLLPPPHAHRDHPERLRHLRLGRGLQLPQLHRRQPAPGLIPASHVNVASPCTHITPLPSGPVTMPMPGAISAASPGSSGNGNK